MAMVNTGLGWEAPSDYLVYAADTYLGYVLDRNFYKTYTGYAIAVFQQLNSEHGGWTGPLLISTDPDAALYYYGATYPTGVDHFSYLHKTWYFNYNHHYAYPHDWGTPLHVIDPFEYGNDWTVIGPKFLESIGVKPHVSWRGVSFAAGMAAGLATKEWAYEGV